MSGEICTRRNHWFHAANTADKVRRALHPSYKYTAVEVDLSFMGGHVYLAHDQHDNTVDTSLSQFLSILVDTPLKFIVKFDFKDVAAILQGLAAIGLSNVSHQHTIISNWDGVRGPAGGSHIAMSGLEFASRVRDNIPSSEISIGLNDKWHPATLFFSHGYTRHHAHQLANIPNTTSALRMTILSQTRRDVVVSLFHNRKILVWGEAGFFEAEWLTTNKHLCLDADLMGPGWWVLAQYAWIVLLVVSAMLLYCRFAPVLKKPAYRHIPPDSSST